VVVLAAVSLFSAHSGPALADEPFAFQMIEEIPMPKSEIYKNSLLWLAETFRSSKAVIDLKDEELGTIIGNGITAVRVFGTYSDYRFKLRIDIKENRYRLTFKDVELETDFGWKPIEAANRKALEPRVTKKFQEIVGDYHSYLLNAPKASDWRESVWGRTCVTL
jgi:hypothetical protein